MPRRLSRSPLRQASRGPLPVEPPRVRSLSSDATPRRSRRARRRAPASSIRRAMFSSASISKYDRTSASRSPATRPFETGADQTEQLGHDSHLRSRVDRQDHRLGDTPPIRRLGLHLTTPSLRLPEYFARRCASNSAHSALTHPCSSSITFFEEQLGEWERPPSG